MACEGSLGWFGSKACISLVAVLTLIARCKSERNSSEILNGIFKNYDHRVRPNVDGPPVVVSLELSVERIGDISERSMDFSATVFLIESWTDERLEFEGVDILRLSGLDIYRLWMPDLFFPFEAEARLHDVTTPNLRVVLSSNGRVRLMLRATLKLACPMDLSRFPMDEQTCNISMLSYQYSTNDLLFQMNDADFKLPQALDVSRFRLVGQETSIFDIPYGIENHNCAQATIKLQRRLETYILTMYLPSILLVGIAWLSFWIDPKCAPARVTMGVTINLTLNTMSSGTAGEMPLSSGAKALDIWQFTCQAFALIALVEYAIASYSMLNEQYKQQKYKRKLKRERSLQKSPDEKILESKEEDAEIQDDPVEIAYVLDRGSRSAFVILFLIFNAVYWFCYLGY